jgi:polysaccharide export outer membrane protein
MKNTQSIQQALFLVPVMAIAIVGQAWANQASGNPPPKAPSPAPQAPTTTAAPARPQSPAVPPATAATAPATAAIPSGVTPPADYVIGPDDVLSIVFWRDKDLSNDVVVRPDGRISLPLLNDVVASGLTPEQLGVKLKEQATRFVEDPNVTVVVKAINSRRVFINGNVAKQGAFALTGPMTVLQLLSITGGLLEYADAKNIIIMRTVNGKPVNFKFNYKEVVEQKNLQQNIDLKPGDTVIVP